jgi:hypothetical protein
LLCKVSGSNEFNLLLREVNSFNGKSMIAMEIEKKNEKKNGITKESQNDKIIYI